MLASLSVSSEGSSRSSVKAGSLQSRVLSGVGWSIAMRWMIRGLGVINTLILARLLEPEHFGIVAMAMMAVSLVNAMFEFGVSTYLLQKKEVSQSEYDSAWTLRLIQGLVASTVLFCSIGPAVRYFKTPVLQPMLICLAFLPLVKSLNNIRIVSLQKKLEMARDFRFRVASKLLGFFATVIFALLLRNHWALVWGTLTGATATAVISYFVVPGIPRISFRNTRDMLGFSSWLWLRNLGAYGHTRIDQLILGGRLPTSELGMYVMAFDIAEMPTASVVSPMGRALMPGFVLVKNDRIRLRKAFCKAFGLLAACALPINVGLALVAEDAVQVVLGEKWMPAVQPLQILSIVTSLLSLRYTASLLLTALGRVRFVAVCAWIQVILFVLMCSTIFTKTSMADIAFIRLGLGVFMSCLIIGYVVFIRVVGLRDILAAIARPVVACFLMSIVVVMCKSSVDISSTYAALAIQVTLGAVAYCLSLFLAWWLVGKPESAESWLLSFGLTLGVEREK